MTPEELENWQKVKEHFEALPEDQRSNHFYKRACLICAGKPDPIDVPVFEPKEKEKED